MLRTEQSQLNKAALGTGLRPRGREADKKGGVREEVLPVCPQEGRGMLGAAPTSGATLRTLVHFQDSRPDWLDIQIKMGRSKGLLFQGETDICVANGLLL